MLGLAPSMGSMCCQSLREHGWLTAFGATRVRAPGVLMPLLGLLPLLVDHRHLAGAKHLRHSPEPLTLLHLLPWLTVHPAGRGPCLHDRAPYDDVRRALLPLDFAIGRKHSRGGSKRRILSTWFWRGPHVSCGCACASYFSTVFARCVPFRSDRASRIL